ncbi:unnamed protein product [Colias eurytheme]|nr:unnamed protein product [Colias eurytheme]
MTDFNSINDDIENISVSESHICQPEDSISYVKNIATDFKILHVNIRSINCNFTLLQTLLHRLGYQLDILVLSECWLSKAPFIPLLPGYDFHQSNFTNQNEGVVTYVRVGLKCKVTLPTLNDANCVILEFHNSLAVVALYRSPSFKNLEPFLSSLESVLLSVKINKSIAVIGDLNINIISNKTDSSTDDYLNLLASHALLPAHLFPTREDNCLDHVMLRTLFRATTLVLDTTFTDHAPVLCFIHTKIAQPNKNTNVNSRIDIPSVVNALENTDFSSVLVSSDPEESASKVKKHLDRIKISLLDVLLLLDSGAVAWKLILILSL